MTLYICICDKFWWQKINVNFYYAMILYFGENFSYLHQYIFGNKIWNLFHVYLYFLRIYEQIRFIYLWTIIDLSSQISFTVKQVVKALVILNLVFKYILIFGLTFCNTTWFRFTHKGNIWIHVKLACENSNPTRWWLDQKIKL